ncbi:unnamed protein product [Moneuplotes crassus]|uniref:C2H2-type domain-containing protein n=1 Tax=Euplotes crassus TaxID=5936 RepID=A0AAD2DB72_EUPCR|nr:unnamed protein product [Moneuplotes crassus]
MQNILPYQVQGLNQMPYVLMTPAASAYFPMPISMQEIPVQVSSPVGPLTNTLVDWNQSQAPLGSLECGQAHTGGSANSHIKEYNILQQAHLDEGYYKECGIGQPAYANRHFTLPSLNQISAELVDSNEHQRILMTAPDYNLCESACKPIRQGPIQGHERSMMNTASTKEEANFVEKRQGSNSEFFTLEKFCICNQKVADCYNMSISFQHSSHSSPASPNPSDEVRTKKSPETNFLEELDEYQGSFEQLKPSINNGKKTHIFRCKVNGCNKGFHRAQNIVMHLRVHFGVKKFSCDYCERKFTQKGNRDKHMKLHLTPSIEERRNISCKWCGVMFTEKHNLQSHIKQMHEMKDE